MPLPPLWGLGYQQCRYSYETRARVEEVARAFRRRKIPCDAIYLDIHYMDAYRVFTFGKRFPRPRQMIAQLRRQGFKVITIVDPGVKNDRGFGVLRRGLQKQAFIKAPRGKRDYLGEVWPGTVRFPDFLNGRTRTWWGEEQAAFQRLGVAGFWNDMNEPADFSAPNKDLPGDCRHVTAWGKQLHASVHNVYGSEMARASYEGALAHQPDVRPYIITRAGYAGVQRYALVWTGDNHSTWDHLADSVPMLLNLSLSGVPFCGADVGGFMENATGELLARWTQLGAFTPFFRNHSNTGTIDQEPWAFGPRIEAICRRYIELRYRLLPYLYSLFVQAHRHGTPIIRPLLWHYAEDPLAVAASDQFLLGPDLLIAPILRPGDTVRSLYLPAGAWYDFQTGRRIAGRRHILAEAPLDRIPLYVRAGALLPMIPAQQYVGEKNVQRVELHYWMGGRGELNWYEDDGVSLGYQHGGYHERPISTTREQGVLRLQFGAASGGSRSRVRLWRIIVHGSHRPLCTRGPSAAHNEPPHSCSEVRNQNGAFEIAVAARPW
jgi:alpha-glucosidase